MYVDGGINGLVLYRLSNEQFLAFERTSTQLPDNPAAKAFVQKDNFTLRDTVSGSEWRIIDGIVTKNPATWPLRQYGTNYDGNLLNIINWLFFPMGSLHQVNNVLFNKINYNLKWINIGGGIEI